MESVTALCCLFLLMRKDCFCLLSFYVWQIVFLSFAQYKILVIVLLEIKQTKIWPLTSFRKIFPAAKLSLIIILHADLITFNLFLLLYFL